MHLRSPCGLAAKQDVSTKLACEVELTAPDLSAQNTTSDDEGCCFYLATTGYVTGAFELQIIT